MEAVVFFQNHIKKLNIYQNYTYKREIKFRSIQF
jgi:hypothetical protein